MPQTLRRPSAAEIRDAARRIRSFAVPTPLVPIELPDAPCEIWVKLECLQPIGSFKIRGAANALAQADPEALSQGVYTGSAGNMAQGVAWVAREMGLPCRVVLPDGAPKAKVEAIQRLGAHPVPVPFDEWWRVLMEHGHPDEAGFFVHPVSDPAVVTGNGTVGLEITDALPDVDAIVVPYGGGGLSCGIGSWVNEAAPNVPVFAAEVDTAAPLAASLAAGRPTSVTRVPTFVDGIGAGSLLPEMWPLARSVIEDSIVVSLPEVCDAIRTLAQSTRIIAEGAGGAALAAACSGQAGSGRVVAVISGGNIDVDILAAILAGKPPPR